MASTGRDPARADGQVVGAMAIVTGVAWLLHRSGLVELSVETTLSVLLVLLGVGLVATARRPGGKGLIVLGALLTVALASTSSLDVGVLKGGFGDRTIRPLTVEAARAETTLGAGSFRVDLRGIRLPETGPTRLTYTVGIGDLDVVLPPEVPVTVRARMEGGDASILGRAERGANIDLDVADEGAGGESAQGPRLELVVTMGFGDLRVDRGPF